MNICVRNFCFDETSISKKYYYLITRLRNTRLIFHLAQIQFEKAQHIGGQSPVGVGHSLYKTVYCLVNGTGLQATMQLAIWHETQLMINGQPEDENRYGYADVVSCIQLCGTVAMDSSSGSSSSSRMLSDGERFCSCRSLRGASWDWSRDDGSINLQPGHVVFVCFLQLKQQQQQQKVSIQFINSVTGLY